MGGRGSRVTLVATPDLPDLIETDVVVAVLVAHLVVLAALLVRQRLPDRVYWLGYALLVEVRHGGPAQDLLPELLLIR